MPNQISETASRIFLLSNTQALSAEFELSWSHYLKLMRIDDENERNFHEIEAVKNNWETYKMIC